MGIHRVRFIFVLLFAVALLSFPRLGFCDAGVPLISVFWPPMWLALIPVVLIEAYINKRLLGVSLRQTLVPATYGNLASTLLGIPFMWIVLASMEFGFFGTTYRMDTIPGKLYAVTIQSPWLIPYEEELRWMVPAALLIFSIPCWIVSVLVEAPINGIILSNSRRKSVWRATAISNVASYILLGLLSFALWWTPFDIPFLSRITEGFMLAVFYITNLLHHFALLR